MFPFAINVTKAAFTLGTRAHCTNVNTTFFEVATLEFGHGAGA